MRGADECAVIAQGAAGPRVLQQRAEILAFVQQRVGITQHDFEIEIARAGLQHGDGLRMAVSIDQETH